MREDDLLNYKEENDDLGYYPDGVKRTLTDDQIAIFRHSEVQRLLKQERAARKASEEEQASPSEVEAPDAEDTLHNKTNLVTEGTVAQDHEIEDRANTMLAEDAENLSSSPEEVRGTEDDEEEYKEFLEQERKEFATLSEKERQKKRKYHLPYDRIISTRRKIRDMDAVVEDNPVLDY